VSIPPAPEEARNGGQHQPCGSPTERRPLLVPGGLKLSPLVPAPRFVSAVMPHFGEGDFAHIGSVFGQPCSGSIPNGQGIGLNIVRESLIFPLAILRAMTPSTRRRADRPNNVAVAISRKA
jgi:hypothetical protein